MATEPTTARSGDFSCHTHRNITRAERKKRHVSLLATKTGSESSPFCGHVTHKAVEVPAFLSYQQTLCLSMMACTALIIAAASSVYPPVAQGNICANEGTYTEPNVRTVAITYFAAYVVAVMRYCITLEGFQFAVRFLKLIPHPVM